MKSPEYIAHLLKKYACSLATCQDVNCFDERKWSEIESAEMARALKEFSEAVKDEAKLLVPISDLRPGDIFRKLNGEYVHLKLSESSIKFHRLNFEFCYGVSETGHLAKIKPETLVVRMNWIDMWNNEQLKDESWNQCSADCAEDSED